MAHPFLVLTMKTLLAFYQLLDSALPVGAFAHSFGVETMIQENEVTSLAQLREFIETLLTFNIATSDCLLIKAVYTLDAAQIYELDSLLDASRVSRETREGMRRIGKQALKLGKTLHPEWDWKNLESAFASKKCALSWPLVFGFWSRELGVSLDAAATGYLYTCATSTLSVAVRLSLIGQTNSQILLSSLHASCEVAWDKAKARDPFDFSTSLFNLEFAQVKHEELDARLFMS